MKSLFILLALPLYACSTLIGSTTCTMLGYSNRTSEAWDSFAESESLAVESTLDETINLPLVVSQLQQTRVAYAELELPSCYEATHKSHIEYMDLTIEAWSYLAEGGDEFDSEFSDLHYASIKAFERATDEFFELGK